MASYGKPKSGGKKAAAHSKTMNAMTRRGMSRKAAAKFAKKAAGKC